MWNPLGNEETEVENTDEQEQIQEQEQDIKSPEEELSSGLEKLFTEDSTDEEVDETADDETTDEVQQETDEESEEESAEKVEVPAEQVDVGRQLGLTDEQIVSLAENNPAALERMVEKFHSKLRIEPSPVQESAKEEVENKVSESKLSKLNLEDFGELSPDAKVIMEKMVDKLNPVIESINQQQEKFQSVEEKERIEFIQQVDSIFDKLNEDFESFGNSSSLTKEEMETRTDVYSLASALMNSRKLGLNEAVEKASLMWAVDKFGLDSFQKAAEETVKEEINKNKKRFIARPGGKKTKQKFASKDEEALATLEAGMEKIFE